MIQRFPTHCGDTTCASAVRAGSTIYLAHHAGGFDKLDAAHQTREAFKSLEQTLAQAGASLHDMVQIHLYLRDLRDFPAARDVFVEVFGDESPARMSSTTEFLCDECLVMMDGVAYIEEAK